jgi:serine/threonine protein kinase
MENQPQPSELIGDRYEIIQVLGQGSTGKTYSAKDCHSGELVALKELTLLGIADWKALELFEREAHVLSTIDHPNIPQYLNYFQIDTEDNHYFYLVQTLAEGISLANLVKQQGKLPEGQVKKIAIQILYILDYLHSLIPPIIHRDIKPHNLIYSSGEKIYLVDFGSVQNVYRNTLTQGSTVVGTYGYMAPEQFRGQAYISSDLYGLGATLIYLLAARSPGDLPQHRLKVNFHPFVEIEPQFADWLEKMIEPAPEDRFSSAKEALLALMNQLGEVQPNKSGISCYTNEDKLIVDIPFFSCQLSLFWLFLNVALTIILANLIIGFPWLILLPLFFIVWFAKNLTGNFHLEIDRQKFFLQWRWLGLSYSRHGKTAHIDRVELNTRYNLNGNPITACALIVGVHSYWFAQSISSEEKNWLLAKIQGFLNSLRPEI